MSHTDRRCQRKLSTACNALLHVSASYYFFFFATFLVLFAVFLTELVPFLTVRLALLRERFGAALLLEFFGACFFLVFLAAGGFFLLVRFLDAFLGRAGSGFGAAWYDVRRPIQNSISRADTPVMNRFCHPSLMLSENVGAERFGAVKLAVARNA